MRNISMDELDQRLRRPHDPAEGGWGAFLGAFGIALRGLAGAFNPFLAAGGFLVALVVSAVALSFLDQVPTPARFVGAFSVAATVGYLAGRLGNAILIALALLASAAVLGGVGYGVWLALS